MPLLPKPSWKSYFLGNPTLDKSNDLIDTIKASTGVSIPFEQSFTEVSKNPGVSFISLDPSKLQIQLFHHGTILGGSWSSPSKQFITLLGTDIDAKPIQLIT
jgi:hypothetical protein